MMNNESTTGQGEKGSEEDDTETVEEDSGSSFWDPSSKHPDEMEGADGVPEFADAFESREVEEIADIVMEKGDAFLDFDA